ncbi:hypothetical protein, partial [uncultured Bifidobacterium sp.]|uniref:hypothetical protein n=1 Tax=uncultured Bifidobacterium sp. TaxID=165187 RepID=UPI00262FF32B
MAGMFLCKKRTYPPFVYAMWSVSKVIADNKKPVCINPHNRIWIDANRQRKPERSSADHSTPWATMALATLTK